MIEHDSDSEKISAGLTTTKAAKGKDHWTVRVLLMLKSAAALRRSTSDTFELGMTG